MPPDWIVPFGDVMRAAGTFTAVTWPGVTLNGVFRPVPLTVPVVAVRPVMNRVSVGLLRFAGKASQKSVPLESAAARAEPGLANASRRRASKVRHAQRAR